MSSETTRRARGGRPGISLALFAGWVFRSETPLRGALPHRSALWCAGALICAGCLGVGSERGRSGVAAVKATDDTGPAPGTTAGDGSGVDLEGTDEGSAGGSSPADTDPSDTTSAAQDEGHEPPVSDLPPTDLPEEDPGGDTSSPEDPGTDAPSTEDLPTGDAGAQPPPDGLSCPLQWEECLGAFPGCYMEPCDDFAPCPVTGCDTDGPVLNYVLHGRDLCGNGWVVLGDDEGRLGVSDVGVDGYEGMTFTLLLDGEALGRCSIMGLPTGAIRYQMECLDSAGERFSATVLEESWGGPCPQCEDSSGCYELQASPINCLTIMPCPEVPDRISIEAGTGGFRTPCSVTLRFEAEPAPAIGGWISHAGILTLRASGANAASVHCSLPPTAEGFGPAVCMMGSGGEPMELDAHLVRVPDDPCALPQCISEQTCEILEIGDSCQGGDCRCEGNPACDEGTVCVPGRGAPAGCGPEPMWRDPRACEKDADCLECVAAQQPVCCDELIDGSALDAVNYLHDCPACCSCSQSCEDVVAPTSVSCRSGRCTYGW